MKTATISETKNRLSALLELVRQGESVLILDRDCPVARLEPLVDFSAGDQQTRLAALERQGVVRPARRPLAKEFLRRKLPKPRGGASIVAALLADREEGR